MAFTYDDAHSSDRDRVRMGLADPQQQGGIFTDAEIDAFLANGGNVEGAIRLGLRALMAHHASRGDFERVQALGVVLDAYGGDDMPTVTVTMPALLPMDRGYAENS